MTEPDHLREPRHLTAEILVDGTTISGTVRDHAGHRQAFSGWLQLIGLLQPGDGSRPGADAPRAGPDSQG